MTEEEKKEIKYTIEFLDTLISEGTHKIYDDNLNDIKVCDLRNLIENQQELIEELETEKNNFHNLYVDRHIKVSKYETTISNIQDLLDRYDNLDYISSHETLMEIEKFFDKEKDKEDK